MLYYTFSIDFGNEQYMIQNNKPETTERHIGNYRLTNRKLQEQQTGNYKNNKPDTA